MAARGLNWDTASLAAQAGALREVARFELEQEHFKKQAELTALFRAMLEGLSKR